MYGPSLTKKEITEERVSSWAQLLLGFPGEQEQLLPRAEGGDPDLLQLLVGERGERGQVDLVAHKDIGIPE